MTFLLRGIGTTLGCLWGWAAWESYHGNRIVCTAMIFVGLIPATYVQLGTKYPKAGMVSIVSMCVVALATELETIPGKRTFKQKESLNMVLKKQQELLLRIF